MFAFCTRNTNASTYVHNLTQTYTHASFVVTVNQCTAVLIPVQVNIGDKVIEQGDDGDNFYVVGQ